MFGLIQLIDHADLAQSFFPLPNDEVVLEHFNIFEQDVIPMRNDFLPIEVSRFVDRRFHQPEIFGIPVGHDVKFILKVLDGIFMITLPWIEDLKCAIRSISFQEAIFTGKCAAGDDKNKSF